VRISKKKALIKIQRPKNFTFARIYFNRCSIAIEPRSNNRILLDHRRLGALLSNFRITTLLLLHRTLKLDKCSHKKLILISKKLASFDAPFLCDYDYVTLYIRWPDSNGTVTKINGLIGVQFHQKYYTKCIVRMFKKCKNRSLIGHFAPFLGSTSTPLLHGR